MKFDSLLPTENYSVLYPCSEQVRNIPVNTQAFTSSRVNTISLQSHLFYFKVMTYLQRYSYTQLCFIDLSASSPLNVSAVDYYSDSFPKDSCRFSTVK
jgi:hypothetical protein